MRRPTDAGPGYYCPRPSRSWRQTPLPRARRCLCLALIVEAILNLINQGDALFSDGRLNWTKLILTFAVPYCVATYGAVSFRLSRSRDEREPSFLQAANGDE